MSKQQSRQQDVAEQFLRNNAACEHVLGMFSLFSNKIRFKILCVLKEGDLCVKEIVAVVGGKVSNISQQLKILTLAGYLTKKREEKTVIYHLEDQQVKKVVQFLWNEFADKPTDIPSNKEKT